MPKSFYARYATPILMAFLFVTPLLFLGAQRAVRSNTNKVQDWLPKSFSETIELDWFREHFVADQFVVISWDGCKLGGDPRVPGSESDDPRIEQLAKLLQSKQIVRKMPDGRELAYNQFFKSVTTARRILDDLTTGPSEVPYHQAVDRLEGTMIGPDGRQTCVVAMLSNETIGHFGDAIGRGLNPLQNKPGVLFDAIHQSRIDPATVHLGGPPVDNVAIDEEGARTLARLGLLSGLLGLLLAWWSLRSIKLTLIVFFCGVLSASAGLSTVFWTGQNMDAILMSMPSLVYVLAISGAVHLVNYYRHEVLDYGHVGAPERAIAHGWKPAFLCSITTSLGLASLYASTLEPIRNFGIYSAIGVIQTNVILFLFLPAALQMWPISFAAAAKRLKEEAEPGDEEPDAVRFDSPWARFGAGLIRHHAAVSAACIVFILVLAFGVTRVTTSIDLLKLFDNEATIRQDYAWLEKHVGRLVPMEVVVRIPAPLLAGDANISVEDAPAKLSFLERLEFIALLQRSIDEEIGPKGSDMVGPSLSPATFGPLLPTSQREITSISRRSITNDKLERSKDRLFRSGYLCTDNEDQAELWRISLRAAAFEDIDYGQFVEEVKHVVGPALAAQPLRERVLQTVIDKRGEESLGGAAVCLWEETPTVDNTDADLELETRKQRIFLHAAGRMLAAARLNLSHGNADLAKMPEPDRQKLMDQIRGLDCIVLVGPVPAAELAILRGAGVPIVDSREILDQQGTLDSQPHADPDSITAIYTGVVPIVYKAQRALLDSLIQSSLWSFITITPLMMLVSRSIAGGAVVMLPNVLPVVVVFGGMGWLRTPVDIGSMMSASIALGVAVDDTIHFLTWYREYLNRLADRGKAIVSTYYRCAPPTLQAALISGLGLSVFVLSTFTPTKRLGWLMMTILLAGVVAELIMLPALLAGPLGKAFRPRPAKPESDRKGASAVPAPMSHKHSSWKSGRTHAADSMDTPRRRDSA